MKTMTLTEVDCVNDRLHKASGIAGMIRTSEGSASHYAIENAAWAIEGLLEEISSLVNGDAQPKEIAA